MNNPDLNRLDRIEALVESNARAIEALSADNAEIKKQQARLFEIMGNLAQSHADLAQQNANVAQAIANLAQAQVDTKKEMYRMMGTFEKQNQVLSRRQGEIVEILKVLSNQSKNS